MTLAEAPRAVDLPPGGRAWDETLALKAADGVGLRGALWHAEGAQEGAGGAARGHVLILSGRTEFLEKSAPVAAELVARGFAVASLDWRGQGRSDRLTANPLKGHVGHFTDYDLDLAALMAAPAVAALGGPRLVLGHSMGGAIALGATLRGVVAPRALVLTAPMLGIAMGRTLRALARLTVPLARALGLAERWPLLPGVARPYVFSGFDGNVLTDDRETFDWMVETLRRVPELQLASPTLGWLGAALDEIAWLARQPPPGLPGLCLLGSEEAVVDPAAVRAGAARLGLELAEIAGARHEILISSAPLRQAAWAAIDRFLAAERL